jgi:integrase
MATLLKRPGSPYWYLKYMVKGKAYLHSSGTTSKDKAQKMLKKAVEDLRVKHRSGELTEAVFEQLTENPRAKLAVAEAWQAWTTSPRRRNPTTVTADRYGSHWNQFSCWLKQNHRGVEFLHEVTPLVAEQFMAHLQSEKVSPNTFNKKRNFLRSMFRALSVQAGLGKNPWDDIPLQSLDTESRRPFTPEELQVVCSRAKGFLRYAIAIGIYTGLRLGDVCTLKWDEFDWETRMIRRVPRKIARKRKELVIPMHPVLDAILREIPHSGSSPYLFPVEAEVYARNPPQISNNIQKFFGACGIKTTEAPTGQRQKPIVRVGFHSLRHSFVSLCAANDVPQVAIMELVGHGSPAMTRLYSHAGTAQKVQAIASLPSFSFDHEREKAADANGE